MLLMPFHNTLIFLCVAERWHLKINLTWSSAPSPSRGGRKDTETPLSWRWVRSCCHVTPTTAGSWVWDSCWSGWTPPPACLVRKHWQIWLEYSNKPTNKHCLSYLSLFVQRVQRVIHIMMSVICCYYVSDLSRETRRMFLCYRVCGRHPFWTHNRVTYDCQDFQMDHLASICNKITAAAAERKQFIYCWQ